jgi:hypothetical protein
MEEGRRLIRLGIKSNEGEEIGRYLGRRNIRGRCEV